jgi:hypothetical protein
MSHIVESFFKIVKFNVFLTSKEFIRKGNSKEFSIVRNLKIAELSLFFSIVANLKQMFYLN